MFLCNTTHDNVGTRVNKRNNHQRNLASGCPVSVAEKPKTEQNTTIPCQLFRGRTVWRRVHPPCPETIEEIGFGTSASLLILFGILSSFMVEKFLQWRHCHIPTSSEHPHSFAYMNLFGDAVHNLIDGLIVGGSYLASIPIGISTTLAVIFHEIPQEIGDFGVLIQGGFNKTRALQFNFLTALTAMLGAVIALVLGATLEGFTPFLIPFAAGNFIYIAGSDLIPELRKDEPNLKKAVLQVVSIALGVAIMLLLVLLE